MSVQPLPELGSKGLGASLPLAQVIDLRDFAFDPAFRGVAMIDFFLTALGLDPAAVPPALRRNAWLSPRLPAPPRPEGLPQPYILVCPNAAMRLRQMPDAVHEAVVQALLAHGIGAVATQGAPPTGAIAAPPAADFAALCGLVAHAHLVVSVDTAMVHLADAYARPCLAFFTTHRPQWRVRDYPHCQALHLPAPGLPEALEFARDAADEAAAQAGWFAQGGGLPWLAPSLTRLIQAAE